MRGAAWLLHQFDVDPALTGDLIEERRAGRSSAWFGRQVVKALMSVVFDDLRHHKVLALRAVVMGWVLYVAISFLVNWVHRGPLIRLLPHHDAFWPAFWSMQLSGALLVFIGVTSGGVILSCFHSMAMVAIFSATIFLSEYGFLSYGLLRYGLPEMPLSALFVVMLLALLRPAGILLGGLLVRHWRRPA
jgi:hypothetical protein